MRVTRNTETQLIIGETPWLIAIMTLLFTLIFLGVSLSLVLQGIWAGFIFLIGAALGYGAMAVFVERIQIVFHGPENYVSIRRLTLHSNFSIRHDLSEIGHAIVESTQGEDQMMYRPTLVIEAGQSKGTHPLTEIYSSGHGAQNTVNAINHWLDDWRARSGQP